MPKSKAPVITLEQVRAKVERKTAKSVLTAQEPEQVLLRTVVPNIINSLQQVKGDISDTQRRDIAVGSLAKATEQADVSTAAFWGAAYDLITDIATGKQKLGVKKKRSIFHLLFRKCTQQVQAVVQDTLFGSDDEEEEPAQREEGGGESTGTV